MPSLREAQLRHAAHYLKVLRRSPQPNLIQAAAADEGERPAEGIWQQIEQTWAWLAANESGDDEAARLCGEYPVAGERWYELYLPPRERLRWLQTSLGAARRLGLTDYIGRQLSLVGGAYATLGDTRRAAEYDMESLAVVRETGRADDRAVVLLQLAASVSRHGDVLRALKLLARVLDLCKGLGDARVEAVALSRTAENFCKLKADDVRDLSKEYPAFVGMIAGEERPGDEDEFCHLGPSYYSRVWEGRAGHALRLWESATELCGRTHDPVVAAEIKRNIADAVASELTADAFVEDPAADTAFQIRVWGEDRVKEAQERWQRQRALLEQMTVPGEFDRHRAQELSQFDRVRNLYEAALTFYRQEGDLRGSANIVLRLGRLTALQGHKRRALDYFKEALELYERVGDQLGQAAALLAVGGEEAVLGDEPRAQEVWRQANEIYERCGDLAGRSDAVGRILGSYMRTNDPRFSETLDRHLRLYQDMRQTEPASPGLVEVACARGREGDAAGARELLRMSVMVDEETGAGDDLAESLCELGWLDFNEGEPGRAAAHWERALPLAKAGADSWLTERVLAGLAQTAAQASDVVRALSLADEIRAMRGGLNIYADTLDKLANIRAEAGEYGEALELFEKAAAAREADGDRSGQLEVLSKMVALASTKRDVGLMCALEGRMVPLLVFLRQWGTLAVVLSTMALLGADEPEALLAQALWLKLRLGTPDGSAAGDAFMLMDKVGMGSPEAPWIAAAGILATGDAVAGESVVQQLFVLSFALDLYADVHGEDLSEFAVLYEKEDGPEPEEVLAGLGHCVERFTGGRWLFDARLVEAEGPSAPDGPEPESYA